MVRIKELCIQNDNPTKMIDNYTLGVLIRKKRKLVVPDVSKSADILGIPPSSIYMIEGGRVASMMVMFSFLKKIGYALSIKDGANSTRISDIQELSEFIYNKRRGSGETRETFALKLGLSVSAYTAIENEPKRMFLVPFVKIMNIFCCGLDLVKAKEGDEFHDPTLFNTLRLAQVQNVDIEQEHETTPPQPAPTEPIKGTCDSADVACADDCNEDGENLTCAVEQPKEEEKNNEALSRLFSKEPAKTWGEWVPINRQAFSAALRKCRKNAKMTMDELCKSAGIKGRQLYNIEQASYNYSADFALKCFSALNKALRIVWPGGKYYTITNNDHIIALLNAFFEEGITQDDMAARLECSRQNIYNMRMLKTKISIDTFFLFARSFRFKIALVPISKKETTTRTH